MSCRIIRKNKEIVRVNALNGNKSQLYLDLLKISRDKESALTAYLYADSNEFREFNKGNELDKNNEPIINDVISILFPEKIFNQEVFNSKPGVKELFESNPELANEVYEALGFEKNISLDDAVGKTFTIDTPIEVLPDELQNQFKNFDIGDNFTIGYDGEKFNIYKFNSDTEINEKALSPDRFKLNALDIHNNATKDVKRIREIEYIQYAFPKYQDKNISITTKEAGYIQWYLKDGFYYAELERREFYKIPAKKIQDLQAKLNIPFEVEVKEKLIKIKSLEDVSSNTMKNLLQISSAKENINNFNLTPQQKQQAQQIYSDFLDKFVKRNFDKLVSEMESKNLIEKKCN